MKVIQIPVGGFDNNFSYLVVGENKESILIDATGSKLAIDSVIRSKKLKVVLMLFTHSHPDHIELLPYYREKGIRVKYFEDLKKETTFSAVGLSVETIFTPGHTKDSVCFKIRNNLFTGDTLFVKGVGTTAYGGDDDELKKTLQELFKLPQKSIVWPGHDYGGAKATLSESLANAHLKPSEKTLLEIKKKVKNYEKRFF